MPYDPSRTDDHQTCDLCEVPGYHPDPGLPPLTAEDRWALAESKRQEEETRIAEQEARDYQETLSAEAQRRGCDEDELEALWQGHATYLPDYDDHTSDDPRAEQNITCELGMHVFNPHIERRF